MGSDNKKRPKRRQMCRLGFRYVLFFPPLCFIMLRWTGRAYIRQHRDMTATRDCRAHERGPNDGPVVQDEIGPSMA